MRLPAFTDCSYPESRFTVKLGCVSSFEEVTVLKNLQDN